MMRIGIILLVSGIVIALRQKPMKIRELLKKPKTLLKGKLIDPGNDLPEVMLHLDPATLIYNREGKEKDKSVEDIITTVEYKEIE